MTRKLKIIGIVAVTVISVVVAALIIKLDTILRRQIVIQSSAALNVPTSLAAAHVSIMSETIGLRNFQVSSPPGFTAPSMLTLDTVHLDLNVMHLRAQPLTVDRLVITGPTLTIEQSGGTLNLAALTDQPSKPPSDGSEPMKLIIKELDIEQAKVELRAGVPGIDQTYAIDLPNVTLKNIGTADNAQNGVALKQALLTVAKTMADKASESEKLPAEVRALLKLNVQQQVDQIRDNATKQINQNIDKLLKNAR